MLNADDAARGRESLQKYRALANESPIRRDASSEISTVLAGFDRTCLRSGLLPDKQPFCAGIEQREVLGIRSAGWSSH